MNGNTTKERREKNRPADHRANGPTVLSGRRARQGDIILDTPAKRAWFIGGLAVCVLFLLVIALIK